jgi:ATP-dependent DNA ligase
LGSAAGLLAARRRLLIFDALHRRGAVSEATLYAFDLLELRGWTADGLIRQGSLKGLREDKRAEGSFGKR